MPTEYEPYLFAILALAFLFIGYLTHSCIHGYRITRVRIETWREAKKYYARRHAAVRSYRPDFPSR